MNTPRSGCPINLTLEAPGVRWSASYYNTQSPACARLLLYLAAASATIATLRPTSRAKISGATNKYWGSMPELNEMHATVTTA